MNPYSRSGHSTKFFISRVIRDDLSVDLGHLRIGVCLVARFFGCHDVGNWLCWWLGSVQTHAVEVVGHAASFVDFFGRLHIVCRENTSSVSDHACPPVAVLFHYKNVLSGLEHEVTGFG